ncbi:MAG: phosphoserine phosphatase SerB [Kineosporiaceae bacterium]|jgi:phosphoserine phosphatase
MPRPTLLITVTGADRPGLTAELFEALALPGVEILDLEQVVVRGNLTLSALLDPGPSAGAATAAAHTVGLRLGLSVTCVNGTGDNRRRRPGQLHVTLIGSPLLPVAVAAIAARLADRGANIDRIARLARWPVTAVEFDVSGDDAGTLRRDLTEHAVAHRVDVAVSPAGLARRGRRLVVMDVDSTLIQDEVIELLAAHAGRAEQVAAVTERAMRGELDFTASLHERVAALAGLPASVFDEVRAEVRLTPGARTLCRTLGRLGYTLAVVSGGFLEIVGPLAASLGIHHVQANRLDVVDGRLTGRVLGEVVDRAGKAAALRRFAAAEGLPLSRTVAIGDGANDLDMLAEAGLGIAFNAKPVVRAQADTAVNVPYLDTVLYLLGIPRDEVLEADEEDPVPAHPRPA